MECVIAARPGKERKSITICIFNDRYALNSKEGKEREKKKGREGRETRWE